MPRQKEKRPKEPQIHSRSRQCKHRQDRFWFRAPSGKTYVTRRDLPTGRDLSTSFRVRRRFLARVVHSVSTIGGRPAPGRPDDMKMPEGTDRSLVAPTNVNTGQITRCSRPLQAATTIRPRRHRRTTRRDRRFDDNDVAKAASQGRQSSSSGRVSPSTRTGSPSAIDLERTARRRSASVRLGRAARHGSSGRPRSTPSARRTTPANVPLTPSPTSIARRQAMAAGAERRPLDERAGRRARTAARRRAGRRVRADRRGCRGASRRPPDGTSRARRPGPARGG